MSEGFFSVVFDTPKFRADVIKAETAILKAARDTVVEITKEAERALEGAAASAGLGKLSRAWASKVYPKSGLSYRPSGQIYLKGGLRTEGAMSSYTRGSVIRAHGGSLMALPTEAAGRGPRGTHMTPAIFQQRTGQTLQFVPARAGHPAMLVAVGTLNQRTQKFRKATAKRMASGRGLASVIVFILIPVANQRARYSVQGTLRPFLAKIGTTFSSKVSEGLEKLSSGAP